MINFVFVLTLFGLSIEVYFILIVVAVAAYFCWKWLFNKYVTSGNTKKMSVWLATLFTSPIIYSGFIILFLFVLPYQSSKNFDQAQWLKDDGKRYQMADDLIDENLLIGKDATSVKQLLGEPTWKDKKTNQWTYDMGTGKGALGFMFHNLNIQFNNNKVAAVGHEKISD